VPYWFVCYTRCCTEFRTTIQNDYSFVRSNLPSKSPILAHTAEVLGLVEVADTPQGEWIGGYSWFGSVMSAVEVGIRFGVNASWIIKQNQQWYPMEPLFALLKARFGSRLASHWVTMITNHIKR
jgi:hypothetical protein